MLVLWAWRSVAQARPVALGAGSEPVEGHHGGRAGPLGRVETLPRLSVWFLEIMPCRVLHSWKQIHTSGSFKKERVGVQERQRHREVGQDPNTLPAWACCLVFPSGERPLGLLRMECQGSVSWESHVACPGSGCPGVEEWGHTSLMLLLLGQDLAPLSTCYVGSMLDLSDITFRIRTKRRHNHLCRQNSLMMGRQRLKSTSLA